ncbi:MAG: ParB/RepB/Spo0J family partition protein [Rhodospirillales bacterium]|nr:ParB/RepB/Spo0J family partition protein [Rhodospirillales bacterium]
MTKSIPLDKLVLAECNVRKTVDAATIGELAESIAAHGVLQNLGVRTAGKNRFEVIIGGRRFRALRKLADEGRIDTGFAVPCSVLQLDEAGAQELGITENVMREALPPVEEFQAFAALAAAGVAAEDIARRFGVEVRHVRRRMKLGQLAQPIREALREGRITLSVAAAFTIADAERQVSVWTELADRYDPRNLTDWTVRNALNRYLTRVGDRLCRFVGEDAYLAAGGRITEDLFDDHRYVDDRALLERLAAEKLQAVAEAWRRRGWKWVETSLDGGPAVEIVDREDAPPSAELLEEQTSIEARIEALEAGSDQPGEDEEGELDRLYARLDEIAAMPGEFAPETMARTGVFLAIDLEGSVDSECGLIRREDRPTKAAISGGDADGDTAAGERILDPADDAEFEPVAAQGETEAGWRMPQTLQADIAAWRTQVLQLAIAEQPEIAYDLLVFRLVTAISRRASLVCSPSPLDLVPQPTRPESSRQDMTPAKQALAEHEQTLAWSWLEDAGDDDAFVRFRALPRADKDRLMAWATAQLLRPQTSDHPRTREFELAGGMAGTDVRKYWTPDAANYWGRTTRAHMLAVLDELGGNSRLHAPLRKDALVAIMDRLFNGADAVVSQAAKDAARSWLPVGMAFTAAPAATAEPADDAAAA